eukprot:CAMPEP_0171193760 /NCGR_PEP_ID=MMETSP0790-20130122/20544_1 /TAXON_ID=2925 /ORGANISM="Alexandrium catenella, Strain OF101" /LENGTH=233 /DNA_ID=CAMNT_0011658945 /DNA_START=185 /DNA_END=888 /DNA_ORIENTATION=+
MPLALACRGHVGRQVSCGGPSSGFSLVFMGSGLSGPGGGQCGPERFMSFGPASISTALLVSRTESEATFASVPELGLDVPDGGGPSSHSARQWGHESGWLTAELAEGFGVGRFGALRPFARRRQALRRESLQLESLRAVHGRPGAALASGAVDPFNARRHAVEEDLSQPVGANPDGSGSGALGFGPPRPVKDRRSFMEFASLNHKYLSSFSCGGKRPVKLVLSIPAAPGPTAN